MNDKIYFDKLHIIADHAEKLASYLQVLHVYAESEMTYNDKIGNIYEILGLAVKEADIIIENT